MPPRRTRRARLYLVAAIDSPFPAPALSSHKDELPERHRRFFKNSDSHTGSTTGDANHSNPGTPVAMLSEDESVATVEIAYPGSQSGPKEASGLPTPREVYIAQQQPSHAPVKAVGGFHEKNDSPGTTRLALQAPRLTSFESRQPERVSGRRRGSRGSGSLSGVPEDHSSAGSLFRLSKPSVGSLTAPPLESTEEIPPAGVRRAVPTEGASSATKLKDLSALSGTATPERATTTPTSPHVPTSPAPVLFVTPSPGPGPLSSQPSNMAAPPAPLSLSPNRGSSQRSSLLKSATSSTTTAKESVSFVEPEMCSMSPHKGTVKRGPDDSLDDPPLLLDRPGVCGSDGYGFSFFFPSFQGSARLSNLLNRPQNKASGSTLSSQLISLLSGRSGDLLGTIDGPGLTSFLSLYSQSNWASRSTSATFNDGIDREKLIELQNVFEEWLNAMEKEFPIQWTNSPTLKAMTEPGTQRSGQQQQWQAVASHEEGGVADAEYYAKNVLAALEYFILPSVTTSSSPRRTGGRPHESLASSINSESDEYGILRSSAYGNDAVQRLPQMQNGSAVSTGGDGKCPLRPKQNSEMVAPSRKWRPTTPPEPILPEQSLSNRRGDHVKQLKPEIAPLPLPPRDHVRALFPSAPRSTPPSSGSYSSGKRSFTGEAQVSTTPTAYIVPTVDFSELAKSTPLTLPSSKVRGGRKEADGDENDGAKGKKSVGGALEMSPSAATPAELDSTLRPKQNTRELFHTPICDVDVDVSLDDSRTECAPPLSPTTTAATETQYPSALRLPSHPTPPAPQETVPVGAESAETSAGPNATSVQQNEVDNATPATNAPKGDEHAASPPLQGHQVKRLSRFYRRVRVPPEQARERAHTPAVYEYDMPRPQPPPLSPRPDATPARPSSKTGKRRHKRRHTSSGTLDSVSQRSQRSGGVSPPPQPSSMRGRLSSAPQISPPPILSLTPRHQAPPSRGKDAQEGSTSSRQQQPSDGAFSFSQQTIDSDSVPISPSMRSRPTSSTLRATSRRNSQVSFLGETRI